MIADPLNDKKTVYIAGPMRGIKDYNFPAFDAASVKLEAMGYQVISPADLDREAGHSFSELGSDWDWNTIPEGFNLKQAVIRDTFAIINNADEICLLTGWANSKGAQAEAALGRWLGLKVWELEPEDVLQEAFRITRGDRQAQYGPPDQDFQRTATMWNVLFGWNVEPWQVAAAMVCVKLSRQTHQLKRDNAVDLAGYARCMQVCVDAAAARNTR
jgi:hypothetical protein